MAEIEAQLEYYAGDVRKLKNIEIKAGDLSGIGAKYGTSVTMTEKVKSGFIKQVVIKVAGDVEDKVKPALRRL